MRINRNSLCACGSNKKYKHCCGNIGSVPVPLRLQALDAHKAGHLSRAESLYIAALEENPEDIDVLHMLGVVLFQRLRYRKALEHLWLAAEKTGWGQPQIRRNIGLAIAKMHTRAANLVQTNVGNAFQAWEQPLRHERKDEKPLVSVILPTCNHERFVGQSIASVLSQTYPRIELIVIDDGSQDDTVNRIRESLAGAVIPVRVIARKNRGAPATLNQGAALAQGEYLAFLDSDDYFAPDRIEKMVAGIAETGGRWGFSLVSTVYDPGSSEASKNGDLENSHRKTQLALLGRISNSFALLTYNVSISTGNLFVERELFASLGGFRDFRYNHDWDFCLRASALAEPNVVREPLYFFRLHEHNAIRESRLKTVEDAGRMIAGLLDDSMPDSCTNPLAPQWPANLTLLLKEYLRSSMGEHVPVATLRKFAAETRAAHPLQDAAVRETGSFDRPRRTALVVLGMHRSGTSALTRLLNLCGAYLPENLRPPKPEANAKGFFETEEVNNLNERLLVFLGGAWDRVEFTLPREGDIADDFIHDARAIIDSEYGGEETILIKDPRIGVLAPLWHQALTSAGYRPVYVVPVRNPLEVANSLHARGDMSVRDGLSLWHDYMKRIVSFADAAPDVTFISFEEIFKDWRSAVRAISDRLDVPLNVRRRAEEADEFLDPKLHRQKSDRSALEAFPDEPEIREIRTLYQACLARCEPQETSRPAVMADEASLAKLPEAGGATASFVLCIENNAIRDQALLLCESIRRYGGKYRDARILTVSPRPELGIDLETIAQLAGMGVEYIEKPLNTSCAEYGSANRVFSAAWAETHVDTDFIVVLDSDTVFLDEPELPLQADVAVRPEDTKGSATQGPGDGFYQYWTALSTLCGISLDCLPYLDTTFDKARIRASYNGGLVVARREKGLLTRWADLFARSVEAGLRPYRGSGNEVFASTGYVGKTASEYWGSNQAALALVIWKHTDQVVHYPASYNVPLHLLAERAVIDPVWLVRPPVHVHYHWMFDSIHHEVALELLARLNVAPEKLAWLSRRIPFN